MSSTRSKLISILVKKKLYEEIDQIILTSKQGFDVHVKTDFPEVEKILIELLSLEIKSHSYNTRLIQDPKYLNIEVEDSGGNFELVFSQTIYVNSNPLKSGSGFVTFNVRSPDYLLSSVSSAIESILKYFGLSIFLDVFDANKLSRLKIVARNFGLGSLIDAVVQTAYLSGFQGDSEQAQKYLDNIQFNYDYKSNLNEISIEKCAEKFFSYAVIRGDDAHLFVKSCLSYYAVKFQGFSITKASQILQISRTTLQEHLKLADRLGVSNFFDGYIQNQIT